MTTKYPTDWDIDYYKTNYESEEHWSLRRAFIETHQDKFPEAELVCLAQVFTNIEFLGCRYPDATMRKVALLSKEVAAEYRKERESKLKRTFVGASDAAEAKMKGRNSATSKHNTNFKVPLKTSFQSTSESFSSTNLNSESNITKQQSQMGKHEQNSMKRPREWKKRIGDVGFILYETLNAAQQPQSSIQILQMSAAKQGGVFKAEIETTRNNQSEYVVYINNVKYGSAVIAGNKKEAKSLACDNALQRAREINYIIRQKEGVKSVSVKCNNPPTTKTTEITETAPSATVDTKINSDNKGFKMMKMLGWTGGALGSTGTGIEEPISVQVKVDRKGLGLPSAGDTSADSKLNHSYFMKYLSGFKNDESSIHELVFSKDFTKEERKTLHAIASRLNLKSKSKNLENGDRYLIIHKKVNLNHLANDILNDGPYAEFYEIIAPTNLIVSKGPKAKKRSKK